MNSWMEEWMNTQTKHTATKLRQMLTNSILIQPISYSLNIGSHQWETMGLKLDIVWQVGGCQKQSNEQCLGHLRQANKHHTLQKSNGWNLRFSPLFSKEHHLPNLQFWVQNINCSGCRLIFTSQEPPVIIIPKWHKSPTTSWNVTP